MDRGNAYRERILHVLDESSMPMDVENVRLKCGLKNWESTKALLLEMVLQGTIDGQKTTKSWIFWHNAHSRTLSPGNKNKSMTYPSGKVWSPK